MSSHRQPLRGQMTDRVAQDRYGVPGRILYSPIGEDRLSDSCEWHPCGKWTKQKPVLHQLSESRELRFPTKPDASPTIPEGLKRARIQKRWLFQKVPEACAAAAQIGLLLPDEVYHKSGAEEPSTFQPLMAAGLIEGRLRPSFVLATAAGKAGDVLRINALYFTPMRWSPDDTVAAKMCKELGEDTLWSEHASPISHIKFVDTQGTLGRLRLLLVQQPAATTIFRPQFHRIPIDNKGGLPGQKPSYIDVNPILSLLSSQTGGAPHVDVAINAARGSRDPQVAIIDENGYWSVWDMKLVYRKYRPRLARFGHIQKGPLSQVSSEIGSQRETCRLLWVAPAVHKTTDRNPAFAKPLCKSRHTLFGSSGALGLEPAFERTSSLLICSSNTVQVVDVEKGRMSMPKPISGRRHRERILDLKACPLSTRLVFVLTQNTLYLLDAFPQAENDLDMTEPHKVLSIAHGRDNDENLMVGIAPDTHEMHADGFCMIYIFSRQDTRLEVIWMKLVLSEPVSALFHCQTCVLDHGDWCRASGHSGFRSLDFLPNPMRKVRGVRDGRGLEYFQQNVQFFQIFGQGRHLELRMAVAAVTTMEATAEVDNPRNQVGNKLGHFMRRQRRAFKLLEHTFVVPDSFSRFDHAGVIEQQNLLPNINQEKKVSRGHLRDLSKLIPQLFKLLHDGKWAGRHCWGAPPGWSHSDPFLTIMTAVGDLGEPTANPLPLRTLLELAWRFDIHQSISEYTQDWPASMDILREESTTFTVSGLHHQDERLTLEDILEHLYSLSIDSRGLYQRAERSNIQGHSQMNRSSREPVESVKREGRTMPPELLEKVSIDKPTAQAAREAACDIFLSSFTLIDNRLVPLTAFQGEGPEAPIRHQKTDVMETDSRPYPTPQMTPSFQSTPAPGPGGVSQSELESSVRTDDALSRIGALAISYKSSEIAQKPSKPLAKWDLDADPNTYVWEREETIKWMNKVDAARAKERKRKQRWTERYGAMGLSHDHEGGGGGGFAVTRPSSSMHVAPPQREIMSSQGPAAMLRPMDVSSQAEPSPGAFVLPIRNADMGVGVPASQPVPGAFGNRAAAAKGHGKAKKRAKGF